MKQPYSLFAPTGHISRAAQIDLWDRFMACKHHYSPSGLTAGWIASRARQLGESFNLRYHKDLRGFSIKRVKRS